MNVIWLQWFLIFNLWMVVPQGISLSIEHIWLIHTTHSRYSFSSFASTLSYNMMLPKFYLSACILQQKYHVFNTICKFAYLSSWFNYDGFYRKYYVLYGRYISVFYMPFISIIMQNIYKMVWYTYQALFLCTEHTGC